MSRLSDAWAALCGRSRVVEKTVEVERAVERLVPVGDAVVTVFEARSRSWVAMREFSSIMHVPSAMRPGWHGRIYLTCAQGFAECGEDADLVQRKALVVGGKAYLFENLTVREVQPKPKRAKGARA